MALAKLKTRISPEQYLAGERQSELRHQLIDGEVYAMTGGSENHNLLEGNIFNLFKNGLKGKPCKTFMSDMKLRIADDFFYPDVMVVCGEDKQDAYYKTAPVVIVEVLSKTTRKFDQTAKRLRCQTLPTLEEYVLVEQDKGEIQVFRRNQHWQSFYYYLGDQIEFAALDLSLSVADIYEQVDNEDVVAFNQQPPAESLP
ncbi:Uma2 family endonuclease [Methylomonas sp. EFPC3]|uniref:Uma2 family endonuclease n=1 Tax=Methylomonas sp. EFPC3 TaxID=3021710 RepID=UPI002417BCBE|nr:Uma2 family endonuclease [Methylomonas sp. EFPC3]WFP49260.1 Uma2 family endonuclease [Methylomonas sp. EFPC3]